MTLANQERVGVTPPRWYVTNGEAVVGPVDTDLLVMGVASSKIPLDCKVAQEAWSSWRSLDEIRELALFRRAPGWSGEQGLVASGVPETLVREARDAGEALLFAMHAAIRATRATWGLVHRVREPFVGLVTSSAHGPRAEEQLGQVIPRHDAALVAARAGILLLDGPGGGLAERAVARRLAAKDAPLKGIAMVPVFDGGALIAMIELGRADHPFRAEDGVALRKIAITVGMP